MNTIVSKLAMLVFFLLAVTCAWAAVTMVFQVSLFNILLGILATFFLLRGLEIADRINKLGPYSDTGEEMNKDKLGVQEPRSGKEDSGDEHSPDEE